MFILKSILPWCIAHWSDCTIIYDSALLWWFSVFQSVCVILTWYGWKAERSDRKSSCRSNKNSTAVNEDSRLFPTTGLNAWKHTKHTTWSTTNNYTVMSLPVGQPVSIRTLISHQQVWGVTDDIIRIQKKVTVFDNNYITKKVIRLLLHLRNNRDY